MNQDYWCGYKNLNIYFLIMWGRVWTPKHMSLNGPVIMAQENFVELFRDYMIIILCNTVICNRTYNFHCLAEGRMDGFQFFPQSPLHRRLSSTTFVTATPPYRNNITNVQRYSLKLIHIETIYAVSFLFPVNGEKMFPKQQ